MTKDQIDAIERVEARQLLARIPAGPGYDDRVLLAVEQAMNLEWWRGYHAAQASPFWKPVDSIPRNKTVLIRKRVPGLENKISGVPPEDGWYYNTAHYGEAADLDNIRRWVSEWADISKDTQ